MPVESAGPRLYRSIKFKHLVREAGSAAGTRAANISLNLTPFVDMMTILVCFLLWCSRRHHLLGPAASICRSRRLATRCNSHHRHQSEIVPGTARGNADSVLRDIRRRSRSMRCSSGSMPRQDQEDVAMGKLPRSGEACGDASQCPAPGPSAPTGWRSQADESTDARLINKIVNTAKAAISITSCSR
jgi:hypothetical protein